MVLVGFGSKLLCESYLPRVYMQLQQLATEKLQQKKLRLGCIFFE